MSRYWLPLITLALCTPLYAADDLHSIYQTAKQGDPQFRAAEATRLATQELAIQARAGYYPSLDLNASTAKNWRSSPGQDGTTRGYTLNLNQPLYRRDTYVANQQAKAQVNQAEVNFTAARQALILRVAQAYFDTLAAQDNLQFAQAEKASIERQLEQTKQRFEVGLIAITDVHESQAAYDNAVATEIVAENRLAIAQVAMEEIINQKIDALAPLAPTIPLQLPQPADQQHWTEQAEENNKALSALQQDLVIAEKAVEAARSGHYPTLDLRASHSYSDDTFSQFTGKTTTNLSLQLDVPLYRGGQTNSQVRQSRHQLNATREQYEQQRRAVERQVRSAFLDVTAAISQVKALQQALLSSQSALEASEAGLEVGTRTTVDVLNTRRELYRAKSNLSQAKYGFIISTLNLKQAAGTLSEEDINEVNNWLQ